jgi:glyoxylase-like metal-dependent hydrolase (beta-lactamase superfamily II)
MSSKYLYSINGHEGFYYVDLKMFDAPQFGSAFIIDAERPAIIETGVGRNYERILNALDELDIDPEDIEVITPTHVHLDHAGGAGYLADVCPNAVVLTHERGVRHLVDPSRLVASTKEAVGEQWQFYAEPYPVSESRVEGLTDGDIINLGNHELAVHHAPGHARHQAVYLDEVSGALFTADAAGIYIPQSNKVMPTTPPPEFDLELALRDLETLRNLDADTLLYTHFGYRQDVNIALDEYERVLSEWVEDVNSKRQELSDDQAVIEYFAKNTDMVDIWGEQKARPEARMNTRGVLRYLDEVS